MTLGLIVIAIGFILMSGGASDDPNVFNPEIYNFRRIRWYNNKILYKKLSIWVFIFSFNIRYFIAARFFTKSKEIDKDKYGFEKRI